MLQPSWWYNTDKYVMFIADDFNQQYCSSVWSHKDQMTRHCVAVVELYSATQKGVHDLQRYIVKPYRAELQAFIYDFSLEYNTACGKKKTTSS